MQTFVDTEVRAEAVVQIEDGIITFTEAPTRTNIDSGDTMSTVLGKIRKWLANLKGLAFKDSVSYDEITGDKPPIFGLPSTTNDWVAIFKSTGFSIWYRISVYPDANTFAARTTGGQLMVGNAILDDAAVPLAQVKQLIADLVNGSPEALDTLQELADALGNDPNFSTTILSLIGEKVAKIEGKSLSTNDFTDDYKANLDYDNGSLELTSVASIPSTKKRVYIEISANATLSFLEILQTGEQTVFIKNIGVASITVTLPSDASYVNTYGTSLVIPASSYAEVSRAYMKAGVNNIRAAV
ncbi:MAG: hypothetical protein PHO36_16540 [Parabacteroides sp.]|nr:hypothetical protein [Parabacteroides sp.]